MSQKSELKQLLDESSGINRNLGLVFVSVLVYVLVAVGSTTDLMLLLPDDKPLTLPILSIDLPVLPFYVVVPVLVVGLHINLLINLHEHSIKLHAWLDSLGDEAPGVILKDGEEETERIQLAHIQKYLHPFLFNYSAISRQGGMTMALSRLLTKWVAFVLPLLVLLVIQVRMADYQSILLTTEHWALFLIDMTIAAYYIRIVYEPGVDVAPVLPGQRFMAVRKFFCTLGFCIGALRMQNGATRLRPVYIGAVFLVAMGNFAITAIVVSPKWAWVEGVSSKDTRWVIPHINLSGKTLVKSIPDKQWLFDEAKNKINVDSLALEMTAGLDLRERNLRYSVFENAIIQKVNLNKAKMDGAEFVRANLSKALLTGAHLENACLDSAQLQFAELQGADLKNAQLVRAHLEGANLSRGHLVSVNLYGADLYSAHIEWACLQHAHLDSTNFAGSHLYHADVRYAHFAGTSFYEAYLEDVRMDGAYLDGCIFKKSHSQGIYLEHAHLENTHFENAHLESAHLQYAHLDSAYLDGAYLSNAHLECAYLFYARMRETFMQGAFLQGAHFQKAFLQKAILWKAHLNDTELEGTHFLWANLWRADTTGVKNANFSGAIFDSTAAP